MSPTIGSACEAATQGSQIRHETDEMGLKMKIELGGPVIRVFNPHRRSTHHVPAVRRIT